MVQWESLNFGNWKGGIRMRLLVIIITLSISDDFRMFCGDLGNEVTDETLTRAFARYPSFVRAKVIRDKRTNKTKGYGFVSFRDPMDFTRAVREMNGKICALLNSMTFSIMKLEAKLLGTIQQFFTSSLPQENTLVIDQSSCERVPGKIDRLRSSRKRRRRRKDWDSDDVRLCLVYFVDICFIVYPSSCGSAYKVTAISSLS